MNQASDDVKNITLIRLIDLIISSRDRARYADELGRRVASSPRLREYLAAWVPNQADELSREEWLAERDNEPLDPVVAEFQAKNMIESGWDFSGLREPPDKVREFVTSPLMKLREGEMTLLQRRYWRAIKRAHRKWKMEHAR